MTFKDRKKGICLVVVFLAYTCSGASVEKTNTSLPGDNTHGNESYHGNEASTSSQSNNHHANNTEKHDELQHHGIDGHHGNQTHGGHDQGVIHVAGIHFEEVKMPFVICVVIILLALSKLAFHYAHVISSKVPESCLLIVIGVVLGAIERFSGSGDIFPAFFSSHAFFHYLLPPIILEAAFSLHDRTFFDNIGGILLYAVVGTTIACFSVGYTLYGLAHVGAMGSVELDVTETLVFSALICAVDPVAVLAIFEEVGVNSVLYFFVFGESLLNDGVTVVIYKVMQDFLTIETVTYEHILLGFTAFFVVAGGGILVGVLIGIFSAFVTKYTYSVRVVEPIAVFGFAYTAFLVAEIFQLSGIISLIACGLVQMQYTFNNVTTESKTTIKYFAKVISTTNEIIIFLFLGLAIVRPDHDFQIGFMAWTIGITLIYRFIITYGLTLILNKCDRTRVHSITVQEQFIMSYGGLRGAVCFSLVALLDADAIPHKAMFVTTTLAVIIFTVFIQGGTIKSLVNLLEITMEPEKNPSFSQEISVQVIDHLMAGMETIIGCPGKYRLKEVLEHYDVRFLKRFLLRGSKHAEEDLAKEYANQALRDHLKYLAASGASRIPRRSSISSNTSTPKDDDGIEYEVTNDVFENKKKTNAGKITSSRDLRALIRPRTSVRNYDPALTHENSSGLERQMMQRRRRMTQLAKRKFSINAGLVGVLGSARNSGTSMTPL